MFFQQLGKRPEIYFPFNSDLENHSYCSGSYPRTATYGGSISITSGTTISDYGEELANFVGGSYTGIRVGSMSSLAKNAIETGTGYTVTFRWRAKNIGGGAENVFYYGFAYHGTSTNNRDILGVYTTAWKSSGTFKFLSTYARLTPTSSVGLTDRDIPQLAINTWYDMGIHLRDGKQWMFEYDHGDRPTFYGSGSMPQGYTYQTYGTIGNYGTVPVNPGFGYDGYMKDYQMFGRRLSEVELFTVRKNNGRIKV